MYRCVWNLALMLCVFMAAAAMAQSPTFTRDILATTSESRLTHPADFNNDGREDLIKVCGAPDSPKFAIVLSTGDGTYAAPECYQLPSGAPFDFAVGDFNNDGNLDLIVVNGTSTAYLYLNNGKGRFQLQSNLTMPAACEFAVASDVNHDSTIDLVCASLDNHLYVLFGNGDGTFRTGPVSPIDFAGRFWVGDYDGDGKGDLMFQVGVDFGTNFMQVAYGDGQGHFQTTPKVISDVFWGSYDLNGDGKSDLIGIPFDFSLNGNTYYKQVKVMYGNSNRTFTSQTIQLAQCDPGGIIPAVADFNGDGINDIIVSEASDCSGDGPYSIDVLLGKGDGTYQPEQTVFSSKMPIPLQLTVMRANHDSKPDLEFVGNVWNNNQFVGEQDTVFTNTTTGHFPSCSPPDGAVGFSVCSPTRIVSLSNSVRFSIAAGNQTPGRKIEVWVDGKKLAENLKGFSHYSFLDATLNLTPGTHRIAIYSAGWDNLLQEFMWTGGPGFDIPLTVGSSTCPTLGEGLVICSPVNDATLNSSVLAWAVAQLSRTNIARMEVWVDGVKEFTTTGSSTLKTKLTVGSGLHTFTYFVYGGDGTKLSSSVIATVK